MKWVSVKDRLPEIPFIAYWSDGEYTFIFEKDYIDFAINKEGFHLTHWMSLPEPPKKEK